jgi:hypothetical protein
MLATLALFLRESGKFAHYMHETGRCLGGGRLLPKTNGSKKRR